MRHLIFTIFTFIVHLADTKLIVDGKEFHQKCFACLVCSVQLDKIYGSKNGEYYCETCYVDKFGKKCAQCAKVRDSVGQAGFHIIVLWQVILGEGLRVGEESYHNDCFTCSNCPNPLEKGSVHSIKGKPVCTACYENQFQETCSACKMQVNGLLGYNISSCIVFDVSRGPEV